MRAENTFVDFLITLLELLGRAIVNILKCLGELALGIAKAADKPSSPGDTPADDKMKK